MGKRGEIRLTEAVYVRWMRFLRYGVQTQSVRLSARDVLLRWALALAVTQIFFQLCGLPTRPLLGIGAVTQVSSDGHEAESFWKGRRLIFAAYAGRAGSGYMREVLACGTGVIARHEPAPRMAGSDVEAVILHGERVTTLAARRMRKMTALRAAVEGTRTETVYAETSHMFVKTFADAVLPVLGEMGADVVVLMPKRSVEDVVFSQLQLGWFSKGHPGRGMWYYAPADVHASERKVNVTESGPVAEAVGYNADVAVRVRELKDLITAKHAIGEWRGVRAVEVVVEDIAADKEENVMSFLREVGLNAVREKVRLLKERDGNQRDEKKERANVEASRREVRQKLEHMNSLFKGNRKR